jgi:hypothetical protein
MIAGAAEGYLTDMAAADLQDISTAYKRTLKPLAISNIDRRPIS